MNAPLAAARRPDYPVDPVFVERWSPRAFDDTAIAVPDLSGLLEAARWAPLSMNAQPWRFVVALRGEPAFDRIVAALAATNQLWAGKAAALVVFVSATTMTGQDGAQRANATHAFDTGAAWASFALQARMAGWHTHGMGGFDRAVLTETINLPSDHEINAVAAIGRIGDPAMLPDALRAREVPSQRRALTETMVLGVFPTK